MFGIAGKIGDGHLVRAPRSFHGLAVHKFGPRPTLRRAQDDHRPRRHACRFSLAGIPLNGVDFVHYRIERARHLLMDFFRLVAFHEKRIIAVPGVEPGQIIVGHTPSHGGVSDLVAIEVKDGQHSPITPRIQELVRMPACGEGSRLGFAVTDYAADEQVGIVARRAVGMRNRIAQFTAFMNGSRRFRCDVAGNSARKRELLEQFPHACFSLRDVGIKFAVAAFQIGIRDESWPPMAGACNVDDVQIAHFD